jgi:hypothetical protein
MKDGKTVSDYFTHTLSITNKLRFLGEILNDVTVIEKILRSMTSKFGYVVCSIKESKDLDTMSIDKLQSSLLVHEQRMHSYALEEQALKITHKNNGSKFGRNSNTFRGRGRGRGRQGFDKSLVECFYCHDLGHFQYECPKKSKERESQSQAYYVETNEPLLLMAYVDNTEKMELKDSFSEPDSLKVDEYTEADYVEMDECKMELLLMAHVEKAPDQTSWFLDSGCSNCQCILWQEYQQYMATKL